MAVAGQIIGKGSTVMDSNFDIPKIAIGEIVPAGVEQVLHKKAEEERTRKEAYRHDWKIAIFGIVGGGIMGLITSFILWLCNKIINVIIVVIT